MNKKSGSSLIVVVCMFAVLSIIIISILALTTMGYNLRKKTNSRIETFYGADSGIDIAYRISQDVINKAVETGNKAVYDKEAELGKKIPYTDENYYFKKAYGEYIKTNYIKEVKNKNNPSNLNYDEFKREGKIIQVDAIERNSTDKEIEISDGKKYLVLDTYNIDIESDFIDKDNNQRKVGVNYDLKSPNYGDVYIAGVNKNGDYSILDYVMGIDGNLEIYNGGSMNFNGDVWVDGEDVTTDKFKRGITIKSSNDAHCDFKGKIATNGTLNLLDSNIDFSDEIYAKNIYLLDEDNNSKNIVKSKNDFYVYNDLILKAETSNLEMKDYYGLNDITREGDGFANGLLDYEKSSAIVIESKNFGSTAKISANDMYIAGTAYLNGVYEGSETDPLKAYQSGESIVINRNTKPYTSRTHDKQYLYQYKEPLHIIDQIYNATTNTGTELKLSQKSQIVDDYYKKNGIQEKERVLFSGITATNVYSTGISYYNGNYYNSNYVFQQDQKEAETVQNRILDKQKDFANEVFFRSTNPDATVMDFWNKTKYEDALITNSFDWNQIRLLVEKKDIYNTESGDLDNDSKTKKILSRTFLERGTDSQKCAVFQTLETAGALVGTDIAKTFYPYKMNIIFNNSEDDLVVYNGIKPRNKSNTIYVNAADTAIFENLSNPTLIISKGNVTIDGTSSWNINIMSFTTGDLKFNLKAGGTLGNFASSQFELNKIFKKFLKDVNLGGIIGDNILVEREGESYKEQIDSRDLIFENNWKIIK